MLTLTTKTLELTHNKPEPVDRVRFPTRILLEEVVDLELNPLIRNCFRKLLCPELLRPLNRAGLVLKDYLERGVLGI